MWRVLSRTTLAAALAVVGAQLVAPSAGLASDPSLGTTGPDLAAFKDDIFTQLSGPDELGVDVSYAGVDARAGVVEIGVANHTPELAVALAHRYGAERVRIVPAQMPHTAVGVTLKSESLLAAEPAAAPDGASVQEGPFCDGIFCAPTRGGVLLQQDAGDGVHVFNCTSTFVGTSAFGRTATLTAGHCFEQFIPVFYGTLNFIGIPTGAVMGDVDFTQFSGTSDHAVIEWNNPAGPTLRDYPTNCVFIPGVDCQRETFVAGTSVGAAITQRGITTGRTTGQVLLTSTSVNVMDGDGNIHPLSDMVMTNACSLPGDSGGVVIQGAGLVGTISASNFRTDTNPPSCNATPRTWVAKAANAFFNLGFQPRLTP
jgi:trypsin